MLSLYQKSKQFVTDSFEKIGKDQITHFERTVFWVKKLKPEADEALLIAAIAHDIERAYSKPDILRMRKKGLGNLDFRHLHQIRGAQIMGNFLEKERASQELIERVKMLIEKHEEGGNNDQNLLKDADSVSFFENNINIFLTEWVREIGKERVKEKFDWMYERITAEKAKVVVKDWYEKAKKDLIEI
ncbi:MAG: DUF4202 family protein [Parcubacteria group bacterium]|nr:DUF4202 family protein [Parcubacteria group bacterium]